MTIRSTGRPSRRRRRRRRRRSDLRRRARCRANASKSRAGPAIPTAGSSSPSKNRAPSVSRRSVRISASAAAARLQHWASAPYRAWKRGLVVEALRQAGIEAPVADLIDAHGDGRRRAVFHARRGTARRARSRLLGGARASRGRDRPLSDSGQKPRRRARRGLGHRRAARRHAKAARHPGDGDRCRPRCRRARLGSADGAPDRRRWRASPRSKTSRA